VPSFRYVVADVFTDRPLEGNQVAVFTDAREIPEHRLQTLAKELQLSETVFVYPPEAEGHARLRIFTPATELPFAGHPVLGTAFVLGTPMQLPEIWLETKSGIVPITLERGEGGRLDFGRMSQPIPSIEPYPQADELLAVLGVEAHAPVELYDNGVPHVLVTLGSEAEVAGLAPDFAALKRLGRFGFNCFAGSGAKWKTRMFGPGLGMDEDPATGSAAGPIACHLARYGLIAFGDEIELSQGAEIGRPSTLYARAEGSPELIERVEVGGCAVIVARGEFRVPS
jgi:trans-2,3-dihydro-3-hydroxyanthranilate isomerase